MTHLYLAYAGECAPALRTIDWSLGVNLLVAYPYLLHYRKDSAEFAPARTLLDSGAYSVHASGATVDSDALARESMRPHWTEAAALDVIGDPVSSKANAVSMRLLGSAAWPTFHVGDPWSLLDFYCKYWPKVGLGGMVGRRRPDVRQWLDQVFTRTGGHRFHAFGVMDKLILLTYPFHSADASSWSLQPLAFRVQIAIRGHRLAAGQQVKGLSRAATVQSLRYRILETIDLQARLRQHWGRELDGIP
jgi:hypothetical protein